MSLCWLHYKMHCKIYLHWCSKLADVAAQSKTWKWSSKKSMYKKRYELCIRYRTNKTPHYIVIGLFFNVKAVVDYLVSSLLCANWGVCFSACFTQITTKIQMFPFFSRNFMDNYFKSEPICGKKEHIPKVKGFGEAWLLQICLYFNILSAN